ncbi:hypothetical protein [Natronococcus occultus]|uniref:ParB-like nuclease n=1 Tax=Natronococcus occultus SP4 TaxID=694430 RepID=L0K344_9EURY|nr:hypothetical protein [Natronococcus occultus]AGB38769.1 hypothetical protein Natoc_3020 [Natronococcus occultus SP4]
MVHQFVRMLSEKYTNHINYRGYKSDGSPCQLLQIDPSRITKISENKPSILFPALSDVRSGDWDLNTRKVEDDVVYESFVERFKRGSSWEETEYYSFLIDKIDSKGLEWGRYNSKEDIKRRCVLLDELYNKIKEKGYQSQRELISDSEDLVQFPKKDSLGTILPPEFSEISIDISRKGEFLWAAGMHRLCIAQLLEIEQVPVRVRVRHRKWQEYREAIYNGEQVGKSHPDIQRL